MTTSLKKQKQQQKQAKDWLTLKNFINKNRYSYYSVKQIVIEIKQDVIMINFDSKDFFINFLSEY